jgi:opacity protein-like surface antigen
MRASHKAVWRSDSCYKKLFDNYLHPQARFGIQNAIRLLAGHGKWSTKETRIVKKLTVLAIILFLFEIACWAQEFRNEVTVESSGFFQKQTSNGGITNEATNSGGVMAGYRFNLKHWLAVEGDYDCFRNHENLLSSNATAFIPMNVHAVTGSAVVKLPSFKTPGVKAVSPFMMAGGGAMFFDPRGGSLGSEQTRGAFVYGGGVDVPISKHLLLRAQYRGFVYKVPDVEIANLRIDKYTHSAVPSAGLVFTF